MSNRKWKSPIRSRSPFLSKSFLILRKIRVLPRVCKTNWAVAPLAGKLDWIVRRKKWSLNRWSASIARAFWLTQTTAFTAAFNMIESQEPSLGSSRPTESTVFKMIRTINQGLSEPKKMMSITQSQVRELLSAFKIKFCTRLSQKFWLIKEY